MADAKKAFVYDVVENFGKLSESDKGWRKELNLISWNGKDPKYDIREWSPDGTTMGKGVTLSKSELNSLKELLNNIDLD